ncbi:protein MEI2-like 2 isoform X4 [Histomonas meleagridis]|uniref:protein MEI2-like 2 isoform X4 n=1 Tax=Histomonas meleagridis TaxID=135588 RepID=UPI003559A3D8|nr:protein MEI2-like 2 isoform X4 [Histomonas meleagridis]KAH0803531.1 protein MEI2-like 2 isoform X4 [Histomonas meleagridis]
MDEDWEYFIETPPSYRKSYNSLNEQSQYGMLKIPRFEAPANPPIPVINRPDGEATSPSELESRSVEVYGLEKKYTQENIDELINPPIVINYFEMNKDGSLHIEFYDLRHSIMFRNMFNGMKIGDREIEVKYSIPKSLPGSEPVNNGTIVLFHLTPMINNQQLSKLFSKFGEIKQIRGTPQKPMQRFIEYWDTRGSAEAVKEMDGVSINGAKISIKFSVPGGLRRKAFV